METILEIVSRVLLIFSIAFNALMLFIYRTKNKTADERRDKDLAAMKQNQENQKQEEEELKPMAKTLCDRCGASIDVKDAMNYETKGNNFFVCPKCFKTLEDTETKIGQIRAQIEALETRREQLLNQIQELEEQTNA